MRHSSERFLPKFVAGVVGIAVLIVPILSGALMLAQTVADTVPEWQKAAGGKLSMAKSCSCGNRRLV
jgi:hypothetical protein